MLTFEIPEKFLPFLHHRYIDNSDDKILENMRNELSPAEFSLCQFLMEDDKYKQNALKLIPVAREGPWVVRSMIAGKPVIIGNKLPISYHYEPPNKDKGLSEYLELDLDIGNSSQKAKAIVNACRQYMTSITADIGFVIQGNRKEELPEQMLCSARLHKLNAESAPLLGSIKE